MTNDDIASAPPAPTPDAGSDLAKLSAEAEEPGHWGDAVLMGSPGNRMLASALVNAYRSGRLVEASPSPPPGEDLAGQGEPVAWVWEYQLSGGEWIKAVGPSEPCSSEYIRNIRPLYAAPAPSRPADREEIAATIRRHIRLEWYGHDHAEIHPRSVTNATDAILAYLALRDAPRTGGDGIDTFN